MIDWCLTPTLAIFC